MVPLGLVRYFGVGSTPAVRFDIRLGSANKKDHSTQGVGRFKDDLLSGNPQGIEKSG